MGMAATKSAPAMLQLDVPDALAVAVLPVGRVKVEVAWPAAAL
jgi:hypothetical protein